MKSAMKPSSSFTSTLMLTTFASLFLASVALPLRANAQQTPPNAQAAAASTVTIAPDVVDLGAIEPGSTHPAKFTLINTGTTEVTVLNATPNCKCTAISDIRGKKIAPGGTLELQASLAAPRAPGVKEAVVFLSFQGANPAKATIKGDVRLKVIAEPPYVDVLKDTTRGTVKLRSSDGAPFSVLRAGNKAPVFVGFDPKTSPPKSEYVLAFDLAGIACESMPLWWFVWTDRVDCPVIPLRVRDECTGSKADMPRFQRFWIVKEGLIDAGNGVAGKPSELTVEIEHYNPSKRGAVERIDWRDVKSVRSLTPLASAAFVSKRDVGADAALLTIVITPTAGAIEGELEIETATGTGRVPFTIFGRSE